VVVNDTRLCYFFYRLKFESAGELVTFYHRSTSARAVADEGK
jgi:hypothetical protein